jgi:uncharacterized protein (DUF2252 family)
VSSTDTAVAPRGRTATGRAELTTYPDEDRESLLERGRALRAAAPRRSHAGWSPGPDRPDPLELLEWTNRNRVPELIPIRWGRMLASPFAYYRGSPYVMASDLSQTPDSGINVQICGDAHLLNFGLYAAPNRHLVFDANDFDETLPGPWEWDLKRLAASVVVAARANGFRETKATAAATAVGRAYRDAMAGYARMLMLDLWYERTDIDERQSSPYATPIIDSAEAIIAKARANTNQRAFEKLAHVVDGNLQLIENPPVVERIRDLAVLGRTTELMDCYLASLPEERRVLMRGFRFLDAARKVVGVGSVGTRCAMVMLEGRVNGGPLFLQVKEAEASILEPFVGTSAFDNHGARVVVGQHTMQGVSDLMLGWASFDDRCFYVRQLRDMKGSVDTTIMTPNQLRDYGAACAATIARGHARSGLAALISGYLGNSTKFDDSLAAFAVDYADQNERDYTRFAEAVREGRLEALSGV